MESNVLEEDEEGNRPIHHYLQHCRFCSASFSSEIELILHFHEEHFIPQKQKRRGLLLSSASLAVSAADDDDEVSDELESDLDSDGEQENESQEAEDFDFLTKFEELLLQNPVLDPNPSSSSAEEESDTEPEQDGAEDFWKGLFPSGNSELNGTEAEVMGMPSSSSGNCAKRRQKMTLGLLRFLRAPDTAAHAPQPKANLRSGSGSQCKPVEERNNRIQKANRFRCLFCGKSYSKESRFFAHIRKQHINEEPYFCKLCDGCFSKADYLTKHMKRCHAGTTPYKCKSCSATFSIQSQLVKHIQMHLTERKFECEYCKMRFRINSNLNKHIACCHTEVRPHRCDICGRGFIRPERLEKHINCIHNSVKKSRKVNIFRCSICGKEFKWNSVFLKHMNWHVNGKQFECEHCKKRFTYHHNKNAHIREVHGGQKRNRCFKKTKKVSRVELKSKAMRCDQNLNSARANLL